MDKFLDAIIKFFKALFSQYKIEPKTSEQTNTITSIPALGDIGNDVKTLQAALNKNEFTLKVDGEFGPKTKEAVSLFQKSKGLRGSGVIGPKTLEFLKLKVKQIDPKDTKAPWFWELKKHEGKKETDPEYNKKMSAKWPLVGLELKTISKNWAAWCGLFIAVGLSGVGYQWQKTGALAKNWDKFGQKIEWKINGFPQGAIIRINHKAECKRSSSNHVTLANGDCSAKDLLKAGANFSGYGGNQGNMAKVSNYPVKNICSVSWPKEQKLPEKVIQSKNCSNGKTFNNESTQ